MTQVVSDTETGVRLSPAERQRLRERVLLSEQLRQRRTADPLEDFIPNPGGQSTFIRSVLTGDIRENWYFAANRSGKSDAGAYCGAHFARFGKDRSRRRYVQATGSSVAVKDYSTSGWVVSLDFPASRDIIQPKYFNNGFCPPGATHDPFIPEHEIAEWRVSDQVLRLKNGSIIGFKSADSGRRKFQGAEKDWVQFDEEPPELIYNETVIRVGARPLSLFGTCTLLPPEGQIGGVTWLFAKKIKPWKQGKLSGTDIFTGSIYDNPHIPVAEIEHLEAIYPEGSIDRRIRLEGELIAGTGASRVYSGFDYRLNVDDVPEINLRRPLAWCWDFNVEPMISLIGQRLPDGFYVHRELLLPEGNISEMCALFREAHPTHRAEVWIYGDASGRSRSAQTNKSSYQLILNTLKDYPAPLKLRVPEANPLVQDRINAVNHAFKTSSGRVDAIIDPTCEELIEDFENVVSDGKGGIKKSSNRQDPYFKRTHLSDAYGYWIAYEAPITAAKTGVGDQRPRTGRIARPGYGKGRAASA